MTTTRTDRSARWASWLQATPAELVGLAALLLGGLALTGVLWWHGSQLPGELPPVAAPGSGIDTVGEEVTAEGDHGDAPVPEHGAPAGHGAPAAQGAPAGHGAPAAHGAPPEGAGSPTPAGDLVVHVSGAVLQPGLVTVPAGSRVGDAIVAAGGMSEAADHDRINLARPVQDGEHVHLLREGEEPPAGWQVEAQAGAAGPAGPNAAEPAAAGPGATDGRVDLNRATASELESLPGIGPAKAAAIVRHREEQGPFRAPGDLREVTGIGEKTFQGLADLVTVS
jgi:competence protein ComEA